MPPDRRKPGEGASPEAGEIYFEFHQVGNAVRVAAVDAASGVEVVVMGPLSATQSDLEQLALRKLRRALDKQA